MRLVAGIVLVLVIALVGSRWSFARVKLPFLRGALYFTGTEYLLVGVALGELMLGLLDRQAQAGLQPLVYLALGWTGLLFGLQLELRQMLRFPRQYLRFALLQALITLVCCLLALGALHHWWRELLAPLILPSLLALSAMAVPTAQSSLALVQQDLPRGRHRVLELLRYAAGIDGIVAMVAFGVISCLEHAGSPLGVARLVPLQYLVISLALGAATGLLLHLLTRLGCAQEELMLFTVGMVVFSGGAAGFLGLSPLFVTLVGGVVLTNLRGQQVRIAEVLARLEKPVYLVVLILAGARFSPPESLGSLAALAAGYVLLRALGKGLGGLAAGRLLREPLRLPAGVGLGLLPQGGVAAAMAVCYHLAVAGVAADAVLAIIMLAIVISELVGPVLTRRVAAAGQEAA
jgi:Kef-type K+ transport system membrane component KefB